LKQWEAENASTFFLPLDIRDAPKPGAIQNPMDRDDSVKLDSSEAIEEMFDRNDLLDVGTKRKFLRPGDLVELL
jgi:hypothetical protein